MAEAYKGDWGSMDPNKEQKRKKYEEACQKECDRMRAYLAKHPVSVSMEYNLNPEAPTTGLDSCPDK